MQLIIISSNRTMQFIRKFNLSVLLQFVSSMSLISSANSCYIPMKTNNKRAETGDYPARSWNLKVKV